MRAYLRASVIANAIAAQIRRLGYAAQAHTAADDEINQAKRWWVDIEVLDDVPVEPPKGANTRGLNLERKPRDPSGFAMFPPETAPPGPRGMAPFPLDREAGIAASQEAERPAAARNRIRQP